MRSRWTVAAISTSARTSTLDAFNASCTRGWARRYRVRTRRRRSCADIISANQRLLVSREALFTRIVGLHHTRRDTFVVDDESIADSEAFELCLRQRCEWSHLTAVY